MAGTTYQELLDGVAAYYGSGSDQWVTIAQYGVNAETIPIIEQVPGVSITRSNSGAFLGFDYNNPFAGTGNPASVIDSNVQTGAYGPGSFNAQLPATAVTNPSTGLTTMESGARVTATGATVAAVADRVSLAVAGVALGTKLGKLIDSGIYALNPDWFDENFPSMNPETWDTIATTQAGQSLIRSIFGLKDDSATMYLDERALAYAYMTFLKEGAYSSGDGGTVSYDDNVKSLLTYPNNYANPLPVGKTIKWIRYRPNIPRFPLIVTMVPSDNSVACICVNDGTYIYDLWTSRNPFTITEHYLYANGNTETYQITSIVSDTLPDVGTVYYYRGNQYKNTLTPNLNSDCFFDGFYSDLAAPRYTSNDLLYIYYLGTYEETPTLPGVTDNPNAATHINPQTVINPTTGQPVTPADNVDDVLQALKTAYPNLFSDAVYEDVPQEDGTIQRISYIPVPYPNITNISQPITQVNPGVDPQVTPQVTPQTYPDALTQQLTDSLTGGPTTPPDTGTGDTPPVVIPPGSASALYSIYNPSQGELNSFGAWLWSSNFVDQLLKLFNDPMQAIIGLHKVFAAPTISGTGTIKVGYLDSQVSSNLVGNQYTTVDCGSITLNEYFGNVFDYAPFTDVYIYLPFIGIEKLNTGDVMRSSIHVVYHVDVLTGACLAEVNVTRDGAGGTLYTYTGNAAVQYPISSGSYMGIVASLASVAGGVVGTIASGGALAPVAFGAVNGALNAHTRVQHSGGFSGNAGAMGIKTPYLIIIRPQTCMADTFESFDGYPANHTTTLASCSGFTRVDSCHIEGIAATDDELTEIETLLKAGVII